VGIKYGIGRYYGTRGSIIRTIYSSSSKRDARTKIPLLPEEIQKKAKEFIKAGSNNYDSFSFSEDTSGNFVMIRENPGKVPGSRAIYIKIVDSSGKTKKTYKETYDPAGNLVHSKDK